MHVGYRNDSSIVYCLETMDPTSEPVRPGFEALAFLFTSDNRNRGILRMNFDEAALLWKSVRATHGGVLEIGRRFGGSTVLLALAAPGRTITSIDVAPEHASIAQAFFDRPEIAARLELLVADSRKPLPGRRFGVLFIDGYHSFEGVLCDVEAHWNSLQGGSPLLCIFHDAVPNPGLHPEPEGIVAITEAARRRVDDPLLTNHFIGVEFVRELLVARGFARHLESAGSVLVLEKSADLPADFGATARREFPIWKGVTD